MSVDDATPGVHVNPIRHIDNPLGANAFRWATELLEADYEPDDHTITEDTERIEALTQALTNLRAAYSLVALGAYVPMRDRVEAVVRGWRSLAEGLECDEPHSEPGHVSNGMAEALRGCASDLEQAAGLVR